MILGGTSSSCPALEMASNKERAQAVDDALAGGIMCPFCGHLHENASHARIIGVSCGSCGKNFITRKPTSGPVYQVGPYWTTSWEDAYSVGRKPGAKPVRAGKPFDEDAWKKGVNRNKPKRSNSRSGAKRSARRAKTASI